jgi:hypothetical protein
VTELEDVGASAQGGCGQGRKAVGLLVGGDDVQAGGQKPLKEELSRDGAKSIGPAGTGPTVAGGLSALEYFFGVGDLNWVAQAQDLVLHLEKDIHHRNHPVADPEGVRARLGRRRAGQDELDQGSGSLPQSGRHPVYTLQVELLQREHQFVDGADYRAEPFVLRALVAALPVRVLDLAVDVG